METKPIKCLIGTDVKTKLKRKGREKHTTSSSKKITTNKRDLNETFKQGT